MNKRIRVLIETALSPDPVIEKPARKPQKSYGNKPQIIDRMPWPEEYSKINREDCFGQKSR